MNIENYSEKAIVVRGEDTKKYKNELMDLGGKYNALLKGGPGWIFPKIKQNKISDFINSKKTLIKIDVTKLVVLPKFDNSTIIEFVNEYKKINSLDERLECYSYLLKCLAQAEYDLKNKEIDSVLEYDDEYEQEDETIPRKRLL